MLGRRRTCFASQSLSFSPLVVGCDVDRAAKADRQVDSRTNEGEDKVVADTGVDLPALLHLLHPVRHEPGNDEKHAHPDEELDVED